MVFYSPHSFIAGKTFFSLFIYFFFTIYSLLHLAYFTGILKVAARRRLSCGKLKRNEILIEALLTDGSVRATMDWDLLWST